MALLETKLAGLKARLLMLWVAKSAAAAAAALVGVLAGLALVDYLASLPYGVRVAASVLAAAAAGAWFVKEAFFSTVRATTDKGLALYLERKFPELKDALVSALQFAKEGAGNPDFNSPEMVRAVVTQGEEAAARITASEVLKARRSLKSGLVCGGIVLACAAGAFASPRFAKAVERLWADAAFPRRTFYRMESPLALESRLPRGETLSVKIVPEGDSFRPTRAEISYWFPGVPGSVEGDPNREGMNRFENDSFTWEFEGVAEDVAFRVRADDWETETYRIAVVERPRLDELQLVVTPPPYTGLPEKRVAARGAGQKAAGGGDLAVLRGTRVAFSGKANKPLASVALAMGEAQTPVAVTGEGFSGAFTAEDSSSYWFDLRDREGFAEAQPARYQLRILPDRPPETRILEPDEGTLDVTPFALFRVRVSAEDDLGLASARLAYSTTDADESWLELHPLFASEPPPSREPTRKIAEEWDFSVEALKAEPGLLVRYRAEATDFNTPPGTSFSQEYRLRVKQPSEISEEVKRRLDDLAQELRRSHERQLDLRQQAARVLDLGGDAQAAKAALLEAALAQQGMSEDLAGRRLFLEKKVIWYFEINRLAEAVEGGSAKIREEEQSRKAQLYRIRDKFDVLINTHVPAAAKVLKELHAAGNASPAGMEKALEAQQKVADEILRLLDDLRKVSDISKIINDLRMIQEKLARF